ncbi:MAG: hypothetical protein FK732_04395 [Asgard group archaeon]|nr:hypothetical protein [Asgard group archaeon]
MGKGDMEDLREVLKVAREEVPGLLKDITGPVKELLGIVFTVTEEEAESKAKAIAKFYNELIKAGIEKDTALEMTKGNFVSPADLLKELSKLEKVGNIHIEHKEK